MGLSFKGWLAENNVSQTEIAKELGLSIQSVNLKVNGKSNFTLPQVAKLIDKYGMDAEIFLPRQKSNK